MATHIPTSRRRLTFVVLLAPASGGFFNPWDLAFAWLREEASEHHTAMLWQIALALTTVALVYGWTALAGVIALSWAGLARIGEVLAARRSDLVFPEDRGERTNHVLLTVRELKTRFKSARHQCLRVDQPQFLTVLRLAFCYMDPPRKFWPASPSTLRNHFRKLLQALDLHENSVPCIRGFDFGSLRAGGATWLMQMTENPDCVRRRGRWITNRVMEICIQEVAVIMYLPRLPVFLKEKIFAVANFFETMLVQAELWTTWQFPRETWHFLICHGASDASKGLDASMPGVPDAHA